MDFLEIYIPIALAYVIGSLLGYQRGVKDEKKKHSSKANS